jgi:predicted HAD superfamily phosphohydrolase
MQIRGWRKLLRPEHPVAGLAESGQAMAVIVPFLIDHGGPDRNVKTTMWSARSNGAWRAAPGAGR